MGCFQIDLSKDIDVSKGGSKLPEHAARIYTGNDEKREEDRQKPVPRQVLRSSINNWTRNQLARLPSCCVTVVCFTFLLYIDLSLRSSFGNEHIVPE